MREKKSGGLGGGLQLGIFAAARVSIRLYVNSCKLICAAMYLRRVEFDGRSYAAEPAQIQQLLRRLRLRHKTSALACCGPARRMCSGAE
jgi:hypothetical protein